MSDTLCPRCHRESLSGTVCSFCGPVPLHVSDNPLELAHGWEGYDRDLGAAKREEEELAKLEARKERKPFNWGGLFSLLFFVGLCAGGWWVWSSGLLATKLPALKLPDLPTIGGLPSQLTKAPSQFRTDLALLGRNLSEFASDSERKFGRDELDGEVSKADVARFRDRLGTMKQSARRLEPSLTREERRVLMAFEHAMSMLDGYLNSREQNEPDLDGVRIHSAQEQIQRALAVARGEKVENVIVVYARKMGESAKRAKEFDAQ